MKNMNDLKNAFSKKKTKKDGNQWLLDAVKKSKKPQQKTEKQVEQYDNIYVLYVIETDNSYFYVGRTSRDIKIRLREHLQESKKGKTKKCDWIRKVYNAGNTVGIKLLERIALSKSSSSEEKWMLDLENSGIVLVNSKSGDSENYIPIIEESKSHVWTVKDILNATWVRGGSDAKKGEWYTTVNGLDLYRKGWSMLRFKIFNEDFVYRGMSWEISCQCVVDCFTKGTESHKIYLERLKK